MGPPKAGKTTYIFAKLLEYLEGDPAGSVLYITEQSKWSFKAQLKRLPNEMGRRLMNAKLRNGQPGFFVMTPQHHLAERLRVDFQTESDWGRNLRLWEMAIRKNDPAILVIDTFGRFAGLKENGENDNAVIAGRLGDPGKLIAVKDSLGILLCSHSNKAASRGNKQYLTLLDIRGGTAYAGGLDHVVMINRPQPMQGTISSTCYVTTESRLMDAELFSLILQDDGSYMKNQAYGRPITDPVMAEIEAAIEKEPGLAELTERPLVAALKERGIEGATRHKVKKWLKG